jgi:hypothetical protein
LSRINNDENKKSTNKKNNEDDNNDEEEDNDDDNWQLAAAMANAITDNNIEKDRADNTTKDKAGEEAPSGSGPGSYLTSFWSRGSAKKTTKPTVTPPLENVVPPPHPLTSLPSSTSPTSSNAKEVVSVNSPPSPDEISPSAASAEQGDDDSDGGRIFPRNSQTAIISPKKGPWTAKKFMCAE